MGTGEKVCFALAIMSFLACLFFGVIHPIWQDFAIFAVCGAAMITGALLHRR